MLGDSHTMNTPPPIPKPPTVAVPPPLPSPSRNQQQNRAASPLDEYFRLRRRSPLFIPPLLFGIPVGLLRPDAFAASTNDPDSRVMLYIATILGGFGLIVILCSMAILIRRSDLQVVAGVKRSQWLLGLPLAWTVGVLIGVFWRLV